MPNHKHIRRRASSNDQDEPSREQIRCDSKEKVSALHAPITCSSSVSKDTPPLGPLFLLADQILYEQKGEESEDGQGPRQKKTSPDKKSRTKASNTRSPKKSPEAHSGRSSRGRHKSRGTILDIPTDMAIVSTHESGTYDSVEREKTGDAGAVSFDSSADDRLSLEVRNRQLDSLVPKTVTIKKEQEMRLVSTSSSEVAADATEFVLASGDSSEHSETEVHGISTALQHDSNVGAATKSNLDSHLENNSFISVAIEEDMDDKAISKNKKRQSISPHEMSIAEESISYRTFNRSAFATGTAVKKLCEKRGCWIAGEVADCEVATNVICRVQFEIDGSTEDSVRIRSTPKDLDLLEKMAKLGRVRPGARVNIFRPDDDLFCPAAVLQERLQNRKAFFIQYDDGESEWINLWFHKFEVLEDGPIRKKPKPKSSETLKHASKDGPIKKAKSEKFSKGLEISNATSTRESETLAAPMPRKMRDSLDSKSLQECTTGETVDPDLISERDEVKRPKEKKSDSCNIKAQDAKKGGDSGKDDVKSSHDTSTDLKRKRGRDCYTRAKAEDENTNLSLAGEGFESDISGRAARRSLKSTQKLNTETTAMDNPTGRNEKRTDSKRESPRKLEMVSREPLISGCMGKKPVDEANSKSNDVDFVPPPKSSGKLRTKGKRSDSDLCDTKTKRTDDVKREVNVAESQVDGDNEVAVGDRVGIYWEGDKKYYYGEITKHQKDKKKPFYVEYDDGDSEWVDFSKSTYRFEKKKKTNATLKTADKSSASLDVVVNSKLDKSKADASLAQPLLRTTRRSMSAADSDVRIEPRRKRSLVVDEGPTTRKKRKVSTESDSSELTVDEVTQIKVGTRVAVWWPEDRRYYEGVVSRMQPEASWRPFFLEYDDGEEEWIDFRQHEYKVLSTVEKEHAVSPADKSDSPCSDPSKVWIGTRLSVWWPQEEEYFDGTVTRYRDHKRSFYLEYEDGDREWIDLAEHKFFIVENGSPKGRRTGRRTRSL